MKRYPAILATALLIVCVSPCLCEQKLPYLDVTLPTAARVQDLVSRMTLEEKVSQIAVPSEAIDRLGIPSYDWRGECLHGQYTGDKVTCFPQAIGMGATFDSDLIHEVASAISDESVALHYELVRQGKSTFRANFTYWTPNINLYRDPRWGRGQETYGEDPYLTSIIGVSFIRGLQGDNPKYLKVASAPKHYAVHNGPDEIRTHFRAEVNPHDFWDSYMPHFEAAVKEGKAAGIMAAYSGVNGVPCHASYTMLTSILRKTWGFDGFIVSDGGGVGLLEGGQKYTKDAADTAKTALEAGIDLENQRGTYPTLVKQVQDKIVSEKRVDEALSYLLTTRFRLGMFDPPEMLPYAKLPYSLVGSPAHRSLALKTARESIVLLKNNGILPIEKGKYKKIAVIGPAAEYAQDLYGNYFAGNPSAPVSILEGVRKAAGTGTEIAYSAGCGYVEPLDSGVIPSAVLIRAGGKPGEHGLKGEYFNNPDLQGKPMLTRVDKQIDFDWGTNSPTPEPPSQAKGLDWINMPNDHFSVRWTGKLVPVESGLYDLTLGSDDGSRLYLDGKLVIDNWHNGAKNKGVYEVELKAGKEYDLRVEYFESLVKANVRLSWKNAADAVGGFTDAVNAAKESDLVVATFGMTRGMATEGRDWPTYALPPVQQKLLEALKSTGKPMVVALIGGNAIDLTWVEKNADALIESWFPGQDGGTAVADVLFGTYNPSGRLPVTFYKSISQLPDATDYAMKDRTYRYFKGQVLYPFGYGLSYTSFKYSDLTITPRGADTKGTVLVTATVTNVGKRAGDEVAQLYVASDQPRSIDPMRQLKGIQRVTLKAGEMRTVKFTLPPKSFALVDEKGDLRVDAGAYTISVGGKQSGADSIADAITTGVVSGKVTLAGNTNYLAKDRPFPKQP